MSAIQQLLRNWLAACLVETDRSLPSVVYHGDDVGRMLGSQVMYTSDGTPALCDHMSPGFILFMDQMNTALLHWNCWAFLYVYVCTYVGGTGVRESGYKAYGGGGLTDSTFSQGHVLGTFHAHQGV